MEYKYPVTPEVGCYNSENVGEDPGSDNESKWQNPVLKIQELSVGQMDVYVKTGIVYIKSCKSHAFF